MMCSAISGRPAEPDPRDASATGERSAGPVMQATHWLFEQDGHGRWRWRRVDALGAPIDSGEFHETYAEAALAAIRRAVELRRDAGPT